MCGITGIVNYRGESALQLSHAVSMTTAMRHRGPDDEGYVSFTADGRVQCYFGDDTPESVCRCYPRARHVQDGLATASFLTLGHRRLSILDLSPAGHQPMSYGNGRYWIVYNGEVYNYLELKEELIQLGYEFRTRTDTEVIMAAFDNWGVECQARFNGMWAFIIYDTERQELFISRDRFGIKPLYYYRDQGSILFSSEIKGLLHHSSVGTSPNIPYLANFLEHGATEWLKETAFTNIFRFPFAHFAKISLKESRNDLTTVRYWDVTPDISTEPFVATKAEVYAQHYYDLLKDAVRLRLRSDVQIGLALSGGLDSSSIAYLVTQLCEEQEPERRHKTFSSVHRTPETRHLDESRYIDMMGKQCHLEVHTVEPKPDDIPQLHETVIQHWETPPDSSGVGGLATYRLACEIGCKVTFEGQGADEQQGGYTYHRFCHIQNLPLFRALQEGWALVNTMGARKVILFAIAFKVLSRVIGYGNVSVFLRTFGGNPDNFCRLVGGHPERFIVPLNVMLKNDMNTELINLMHYSDSRSMCYSIEARMPFMDYRLIEFMASIPASYKFKGGYSKDWLLTANFRMKLSGEGIKWAGQCRNSTGLMVP